MTGSARRPARPAATPRRTSGSRPPPTCTRCSPAWSAARGCSDTTADAAHFAERAATVKAAFNDRFLDRAAGLYRGSGDRGYRQTHNVLAVAFGLTPDAETEQRVVDGIAADVRQRGDTLNTGVLGTKYLLPVLTEHGHADLAYRLATQTAYPSWGYMIENGATTMWEHWSQEARSRGHYFLGTVDDWLYHHVAGIRASQTTGYREHHDRPRRDGGAGLGPRHDAHPVRARHQRLAQSRPHARAAGRRPRRRDGHRPRAGRERACRHRGRQARDRRGGRARRQRGERHRAREGRLGPVRVRLRRADGAQRPRRRADRRPRGGSPRERAATARRQDAAAVARRCGGERPEGAQAPARR